MSIAAASIIAGGSIGSSLLNKGGGSAPSIDFAPLIAERRRGAAKARQLISGIRPQTQKIGQEFERRVGELGVQGAERRRETARTFLGDLGKGVEAAGLKKANLLRQQIASAAPEQNRQILEAGAATGGVRRGSVNNALQANVAQNQAALNNLTAALDIGNQDAINQGISQVFQTEVGAQLRQQGVDEDVARFLAETGRADVIRELAGGAEIEAGTTSDIINLGQSQLESNVATKLANAQQRNDLLRSIIGGGATIGGTLATRK